MSQAITWESFLARLCLEEWSLDPAATIQTMKGIESLVAPGAVSDGSVATVLRRAGVPSVVAGYFAPAICTAIHA